MGRKHAHPESTATARSAGSHITPVIGHARDVQSPWCNPAKGAQAFSAAVVWLASLSVMSWEALGCVPVAVSDTD